ncbi:MAG: S9 family peptidase [Gemmatimonadales bacterium]|nr:MAG: S9 family peptidase [Gemmatimonadales bacterium]
MRRRVREGGLLLLPLLLATGIGAQGDDDRHFRPMDVFGLEWATDPQVSPDGRQVVYVRNFFDVMTDRRRTNLWLVSTDGSFHRPLTSGTRAHGSPRWAPQGDRILWVSSQDGSSQLWIRWMDTGEEARITHLTKSPGNLSWSPDGEWIAFTMFVDDAADPALAQGMPAPPEGADWAAPAVVIDDVQYKADGQAGFVKQGKTHVFIVPSEGGTPRQVTSGPYNHTQPTWTPDGRGLLVVANRRDDASFEANDTDLYEIALEDGSLTRLTDRYGPDAGPAVSPDGRLVAFTGFDDALQGYQVTRLYVMDRDGSGRREIRTGLDRSVGSLAWSADGRGLFLGYTDRGVGRIAFVTLEGAVTVLAEDVGGASMGRPYAGGSFSVNGAGTFAYTVANPYRPSEVGLGTGDGGVRVLTDLNRDLLGHKALGEVEEIWWESSFDGRPVQGWIVKPPDFDPDREYPLVLEIHGGPFSAYGPHFSPEVQLYAAAGNVVLYTNPRGSTSYGEEFGNLIHHAYPGNDYDDLMSGVDAVLGRGYVDEDRLFVTGGSGGGVLTAWIVGKTDRFAAAAVQKPVINWASFVLHADGIPFFARYWFGRMPWDDPMHYWNRSPLSLVGNVTTPTMLITGEVDYRTPMSETEQYYGALLLEGVPTAMVRVPEASHGIASRPSQMLTKVTHILGWFDRYPTRSRRPVS